MPPEAPTHAEIQTWLDSLPDCTMFYQGECYHDCPVARYWKAIQHDQNISVGLGDQGHYHLHYGPGDDKSIALGPQVNRAIAAVDTAARLIIQRLADVEIEWHPLPVQVVRAIWQQYAEEDAGEVQHDHGERAEAARYGDRGHAGPAPL